MKIEYVTLILDSHKSGNCSRLVLSCALILHDKAFDPSITLHTRKHMQLNSFFDLHRGTCAGVASSIQHFSVVVFDFNIFTNYEIFLRPSQE